MSYGARSLLQAVKTQQRWGEVLDRGLWYSTLPDNLKQRLLAETSQCALARGDYLYRQGDAADGVYALVEGVVEFQSAAPLRRTGRGPAVIMDLQPGSWFGADEIFDDIPRHHDVFCASKAVLLHMPMAGVRQIAIDIPQLSWELGRLIAHKMRLFACFHEDAVFLSAKRRVMRRLLYMHEEHYLHPSPGCALGGRPMTVTHEWLAGTLGLSRQTVQQVLGELREQGIIDINKQRIEVLDPNALRA